jgi:hypothetical protein
LRFKYKLVGAGDKAGEIALVNHTTGESRRAILKDFVSDQWSAASVDLNGKEPNTADEIHILLPAGAEMFIDDLLLYEPGK